MKTPKETLSILLEGSDNHPPACVCERCKNGVETFLLESDIAEIQRDAREKLQQQVDALVKQVCEEKDARQGMVAIGDAKRLVPIARGHVCNNRHACINCAELDRLRAKHPELFV